MSCHGCSSTAAGDCRRPIGTVLAGKKNDKDPLGHQAFDLDDSGLLMEIVALTCSRASKPESSAYGVPKAIFGVFPSLLSA
jgi:hypothetical protein